MSFVLIQIDLERVHHFHLHAHQLEHVHFLVLHLQLHHPLHLLQLINQS